jgi:ferrochelatase
LNSGDAILVEIKHFFQNKNYNMAILERIKERVSLEEMSEFDLIFSAHGLPLKVIQRGDTYQLHVQKHISILEQMMQKEGMTFKNIHLAYQSKVGPMEWLKPSLEDKLREIKNRKVIIFPIAFTIDNSETDYELEIEYREVAHEMGYEEYRVCRCPNDSEYFVEALVDIYAKMR